MTPLLPVLAGIAVAMASGAPAAAETAKPAEAQSDADRYCRNIGDAAAEARVQWQAKRLREVEQEVEARIAALEAKRAELEAWVRRREALLASAEESVVAIYAKMRPDAAAQQLVTMDGGTAAAILAKLNARNASAILNEMAPERAAGLADAIAGKRDDEADGKKS
ncbi:MotE family protein [Propylenella binzhouense]|uniref:MotE family protein n=1 Tax=Propylenella binzhouense TaxID=2555902 RepID=UPI001FE3CDC8|nr:MotE family protein [Propylenella binzhouense]